MTATVERRDFRYGSWLRENSEIEFANGTFVSTSINLENESADDGCRDKTIEKTILRTFRARTFSRSISQKLKSDPALALSAQPSTTDNMCQDCVVRKVPLD